MFADLFCKYTTFDRSSTNRTKHIVTHLFHPELESFVLDFNVDHSKLMRLSFCHGLPTLQTQKPKNLHISLNINYSSKIRKIIKL